MNKILALTEEELRLVINNTAARLNMSEAIVEKDLWVCIILEYLFNEFRYKDYIIFKGGTSLSKVYGLIERFSEDIDLALDWGVLGYSADEFYKHRSNTAQTKFNDKINDDTKYFLKSEVLPMLKKDFNKILGDKKFDFYIDNEDEQTICFDYPKYHRDKSILQVVRLEIGTLAEPIPSSDYIIKTYISDAYPKIFQEKIKVVAVDSIRTFYEKITILHREANRTNKNYPSRYSRHFYDIYKMLLTDIRDKSLEDVNIKLLYKVIEFKKKFYSSNFAKYDEIKIGELKLIPNIEGIKVFSDDYKNMETMLFGEKVSFEKILEEIMSYESKLNERILEYNERN